MASTRPRLGTRLLIYRSPRDTLTFSQSVNHHPPPPFPPRRSKHEKQWRCTFSSPFYCLPAGNVPSRSKLNVDSIVAHHRGKSRDLRPQHGVCTEYLQCPPALYPRGSSCQTGQVAAKHLDATRRRKESSGCRQPTSSATQRRLLTTSTLREALEPPFSLVTCHFSLVLLLCLRWGAIDLRSDERIWTNTHSLCSLCQDHTPRQISPMGQEGGASLVQPSSGKPLSLPLSPSPCPNQFVNV